jgi:hypothetical protein
LDQTAHYRLSSLRESLIEHLFVGDLLKYLWLQGPIEAEVLKPQVDAAGYDIAIECEGILRHIQLKASSRTARAARQKIHVSLAAKPSGCVVWVQFDAKSLALGPYLFLGGAPGEPLGALSDFKVAKHTKANSLGVKAERPNLRQVPKGRFEVVPSLEGLATKLFGVPGTAA